MSPKKRTFLSFLVLVVLLLSSCGPQPTPTPKPAPTEVPTKAAVTPKPSYERPTFGVVYYEDDELLKAGITEMAEALGVDVLESVAAGDLDKTLSEMQSFIDKGVHGILVNHSACVDMEPVIKKAVGNGIQVVTVGSIPYPRVEDIVTAQVILDDYDLAYQSLKEVILKVMGGKGKLGVIGPTGSKPIMLRARVVRLMQDWYPNVVTFENGAEGDDEATIARKTMNAVGRNKDVKALWCTSAEFVPGVLKGLEELGLSVPVYCASDNITPDAVSSLAADNLWKHMTYPDRREAGRVAVRFLISAAHGLDTPYYGFITANLLTKEEARGISSGGLPESTITDIGWNDYVWELYEKNDPEGAAQAKAAVEALSQDIIAGGEPKLPKPAELPSDFEIKPLVLGCVHHRTGYEHNELLRSGADEIAKMFNVTLVASDANGDYAKHVSDMEAMIEKGVDGIFVDHGSTEAMEPVIRRAVEKGIKVVTFDNPQPNVEGVSCEIAQDDYGHAFLGIRRMISDVGSRGKFGIVWIGGSIPLGNRVRVLRMMLETYTEMETIEFGDYAKDFAADTMDKTQAALRANPDIKAFWVTFDGMAIGVHEALMAMGRTDIPLYSVDCSSEDVQRMAAPGSPWKLTAASDASEIGRTAILALIAACYNQPVPRYIRIPAYALTQEQARQIPKGEVPHPVSRAEAWSPFLVALYNKIQSQ